MHTDKTRKLMLSSLEPGVVSIEFEDGTEETVDASVSYEDLVQELGVIL